MKHSDFNRLDLIILDGAEYRVSSHDTDGIVLVGISAPQITRSITHGELEELLRSPRFRYVAKGASRAVAERALIGFPEHFRDLPEAKRDTALWRQLYVEELLRYVHAGLSKRSEPSVNAILPAIIGAVEMAIRKRRRGLVKRAGRKEALNTPPCAKTLLTWTRDYVNSDFNIMALVPKTHRCGNKRHMLPGERGAFDALIAEYASPLRPSIDGIHERATNLYADFNRGRAEHHLPKLQPPSRSSVYRAIRRMDPYEIYLQRHGVDAANKKFAIIEYGVQVLRPMERVEIDEWEVDLMTLISDAGLLDQLTAQQATALEVTRLIVCVAIDCATRCVVGLTLSRSTSSQAAIRTLEMATSDKTAIALSLGCRAGWHQGGRPESIAADMGPAFVSDDFKVTTAGLHARLINPPGGVAKLRPRIERLFSTFSSHFVSRFRGRTFSNPVQRSDYNAEAEVSLTDQDLLAALVTYVVDVYHQRPHAGLQGETPAACWDRLVDKYGLSIPVDAMDRRAIFGVELERTISGRGVRVFGADFTCDELRDAYKHRHQRKVRLRFDQMDLGWIAVEIDGTWYPAHDLSGALAGISFYQWSAFAQTVMEHNRERAAVSAEILHDGLRRLDQLSTDAANAAQLGRMKYSAEEIDRAEEKLGLGLHLLPAVSTDQQPSGSGWLQGGFEVGSADADSADAPPALKDPPADGPPPSRKGWRFEDDE
ncbi:Mu transposase C-terminal domain-containing protein [Paracoccus cavernae]|uniref:Mu transposase C-terminal domain-containing protein n=1 Tax=Paracoccus cavernae TaxID=1571207 RepID=UPI0035F4611E